MLHIFGKIIQKIIGLFGYRLSKVIKTDSVMDSDERFVKIYNASKECTMTSKERMYALYKSVEYVIANNVPGDFVECGVWKGGSTMLIAHTLRELNSTDRKIYLYDTFEGMAEPTEFDHRVADTTAHATDRWEQKQAEDHNEWCYSSLSEVTENMKTTGYPEDNIIFVKGKVEETIPATVPTEIAVLRLDTDWYESTKHELVHLYPLLVQNGVLIIDDYGFWAGSKNAVDEYFESRQMLLHRIDTTGHIGIKVE